MAQEMDSQSALQAKLIVGIVATILSGFAILWILVQIELSNYTYKTTADDEETVSAADSSPDSTNDLELRSNKNDEDQVTEKQQPRRRRCRLGWNQKLLLFAIVASIIMLNYLLLVFLPSGLIWINFLAILCVLGAFLRSHITHELRRQRFDRLAAILTLYVLIAAFLSLATYARLSLQEGSIYQGPARIVGYDETNYNQNNQNNNGDTMTTRTDLEVAWGGSWACPESSDTYCQAFVNGALCETKSEDDDNGGRRRVEDGANDGDVDNGNDGDNAGEDADEEDLEEENEELEEEVEEEEEENEELEDENEELEDEIDYEDGYYDDYFEDDYWDYDWDSVWGDYACEDLFDADLEGQEYDADTAPGEDEWPYVQIYGSCRTCKAYLLDYYSTEHFHDIRDYQTRAQYYAYAGVVGVVITAIFAVKQRMAPAKEHEVVLLNNEGGELA